MNKTNEHAKSHHHFTLKINLKKKVITISLWMILSTLLILQGCDTKQTDIHIATQKVTDLFEVEDEEQIVEGKAGKIKDSTNQKKIDAALKAIDKIDISDEMQNESHAAVFVLQFTVAIAQAQVDERDGTTGLLENDSQNEGTEALQPDQQPEPYQPSDEDVIWIDNALQNQDILEAFMEEAGENGKNNTSEIKVVKDEGTRGVVIYKLKSRYDEYANQSWIDVSPDVSYYAPTEEDAQNVFNMPQQCSYLSINKETGLYALYECFTHWEYPLLPAQHNPET